MTENIWILHIDLLSWDPKGQSSDSSVNLHIAFPSEKEMNNAFISYHSLIGEHMTLNDMYTIVAVEPSLYPVARETAKTGGDDGGAGSPPFA